MREERRPFRYINLDSAADRRAFMEGQGLRLGLPLSRFSAFGAQSLDEARWRRLSMTWERPMTRKEFACLSSHHALWEEAAGSPRGLVILEDDAALSARTSEIVEALPDDFDLVNLETVGRRKFFRRSGARPLPHGRLVPLAREKSGCGAYFLTPRGARRLLAISEDKAAPADAFMYAVAGLSIAQVEPALSMQVHLLAERGIDAGLTTTTSIHVPRERLSPVPGNWAFQGRRARTQLALLPLHLRRVADLEFRRPEFDPSELGYGRRDASANSEA